MRIMKQHQRLEMNLKSISLNLFFLFFCFNLSFCSANEFSDEIYLRGSYSLKLNKDHSFLCSDTSLTNKEKGFWKLKTSPKDSKKILCLYNEKESEEFFALIYSSENKITLSKNGNRFSYHDQESSDLSPPFSIASIVRGIIGMLMLFSIAFLFSKKRKNINWSLVVKGSALQIALAFLILKVSFVSKFFDFLAKGFAKLINFSHEGAIFLFGDSSQMVMPGVLKNFAFWILPSVIFFSAISSLLYYFGVLQFIVKKIAWVMKKTLGISGSESMAAAANVFIGQTEAPLLIKPYLSRMTKSEITCLMVGGMATIAGGVLAAVIGILGQGDPASEMFYAKHLLTASLMSAPAAIVFAKILYPETEPVNKDLNVSKESIGVNALESITNGTTDGLKLAVNVGAMLIVFTSLIAFLNYFLGKVGDWTTVNDLIASGGFYTRLSFESISGYLLSPFAFLMGVEWQDCMYFGQLLGEKTIINEFIAYPHLGEIQDELSQKTIIMSTYVLCGFANIASIGIQVGGIGILMPKRKSLLAKLGVTALIGGTLACMSTSILAGMLY